MPHDQDHHPFGDSRHSELIRLRRRLIRLQDRARLLRRDVLQNKYNPDQPRVPAGNSGGGQWTSGGGGAGDGSGLGSGFGAGGGLAEFAPDGGTVFDTSGNEAWSSFNEGWSDDGSIFERDIVNRDGSTIQSEYAASRAAGFDERHAVTLDSGEKVDFETTDSVQSIRIGGPEGELVSRAQWNPDATEPLADIQQARWQRGRGTGGSTVSEAGKKLFDWFNALGSATGLETVLGFRANDYKPGQAQSFDVSFVGQVSRDEVERACPLMPQIQDRLDKAARDAGPAANFETMQKYGTEVHLRLKREIDAWANPALVAERSYFKELNEMGEQKYGTAGTARFDVYEKVSDGTRCLYDVKTGRKLSRSQSNIIADAAMRIEGFVRRLIVIELRPH